MDHNEHAPLVVNSSHSEQTQTSTRTKIALFIFFAITAAFIVAIILVSRFYHPAIQDRRNIPIVVNTWPFIIATSAAFQTLKNNGTALDALENGCNQCELHPDGCEWTVGYGGSPNENGETTLDSMVMWAPTQEVGAVGCLRRVKKAISVARKVMELTYHTLLVGDDATRFAAELGFVEESLSTNRSTEQWEEWEANGHVPNFWKGNHTYNDSVSSAISRPNIQYKGAKKQVSKGNHDTIGMVAIDSNGDIACGTSTNGLTFKIPGRVGDSPIMGAGAYCDNDVGGAAATGDGDVMMRFLPSLRAVENMRAGMDPFTACRNALAPIQKYYPGTQAALICVTKDGQHGGAFINWSFTYSIQDSSLPYPAVVSVPI